MHVGRAVQTMAIATAAVLYQPVVARAQAPVPKATIQPNIGAPQITSFTPNPSTINNPTVSVFTIALVHTLSGMVPTEYRVSRFADFRDANWLSYVTRPSITVQSSMFTAISTSTRELTLYLQVRARNPKAGQPMSLTGGQTQVQPDFFFSEVASAKVRIVLSG